MRKGEKRAGDKHYLEYACVSKVLLHLLLYVGKGRVVVFDEGAE
jgi:hypothetical protein